MSERVTYERDGGIATITMDDGKANALSIGMLGDLMAAFGRAEADGAVVVLTGREGRFSGGFDLAVLQGGGDDAVAMLRAGFELSHRMLSFPRPVVVAPTGHTVAMGFFLLLSGDLRIAPAGPFKLVANEVAIGLPMPASAIAVCRQRLTPAAFDRVVLLAEVFAPDEHAIAAGIVDQVVPLEDLADAARAAAERLASLDPRAHELTKQAARAEALAALRAGMVADRFVPEA